MRELTSIEAATPPAPRDRFGLGYRAELAAAILVHLDRIDVVEVVAETLVNAPRRLRSAMRTLSGQVDVMLHGVSLGLCSTHPVDGGALDAVARVVGELRPQLFSEHMAFVRAGGIELGHLAMPPRCAATVDGALANLARARAVLGVTPVLENVATLLEPPASTLDEPSFVSRIVCGAGTELLLDLQNLHVNAHNLGYDAVEALSRMPLERVRVVHLAGGKRVRGPDGQLRELDDHLHAVPPAVHQLLRVLGSLAPQPLTVVIERDGRYPPFAELLAELDAARAALAEGRAALRRVA